MRTRLALTALAMATAVTAGLAAPATAAGPDPVRQDLETLVRSGEAPGALASVKDAHGKFRTYTAGVGDRDTQAKVPRDGQVRIGSVTKTFTAVTVLQLVREGEISLEGHVEDYLPGVVRGESIDGRAITVRQLLQHTSGLPDFEDDVTDDILERRYLSPRDSLDIALTHKAVFEPGTKWSYSNTNYLVAGLIVQKVTGRPLPEVIAQRILKPTGLRHTYFPAPGETTLREHHPRGYREDSPGAPLRDVTEIDPSAAWAAGAMVSTPSDLNRFYSALLKGDLLAEPQLKEMLTSVPIKTGEDRYGMGLGIMKVRLSKDCVVWGHSGGIPGYGTWAGATEDGRAASVAMTREPTTSEAVAHLEGVVDAALCRR
ncbi:serine hydrolase domain-containing protein [Streptomyces sp. G45]|uniref:serine hydrolase domain-containing protein n=1 Tax=Streptomyces sp. G45 TaxID=3406627 RepID=UPI003C1CA264